MTQSEALLLFHILRAEGGVRMRDVVTDLVPHESHDDRAFVNSLPDDLVEDMTQNGFPGDVQQNFGKCECVRPEPASYSSDWYDRAH
jgi:enamine deaminase RidA (YjgF/YER057c/UK114 family)